MNDTVKRMSIKEFREIGYLQELNRQFLHPLGLALDVIINSDGTEQLNSIWDYRDDPEGIIFSDGELEVAKFENIKAAWMEKQANRRATLGWMTQPI